MHGRKQFVSRANVFKVLEIHCSFFNQEPISLFFGEPILEQENVGGYFTLFLGKNGLCKSSLLREIIEFFIDAQGYSTRRKKSHVSIDSVKYMIDGTVFLINCHKNKFTYFLNTTSCPRSRMRFPLVIASTMGMFDKFPVNSRESYNNGRYKKELYCYVGPKANNNMFTSKANVLLQQLAALPRLNNSNKLKKLYDILNFIGYDPRITFRFQTREPIVNQRTNSLSMIDGENLDYYKTVNDDQLHSIDIMFDEHDLLKFKKLPIASLYAFRQNGLLKNLKCCFYKNGKEVDSDYLSSGEFNLLGIVMSVILAAGSQHLLILLDEPEISQHPNWQLDMIPNLEKALVGFNCHFLIATHCHFLVSNLPMGRSNVVCMTSTDDDVIVAENIQSETFGWSAEEVLLKAFSVPTDRNRYLAKSIGDFMRGISQRTIRKEDVEQQLIFFKETTSHLSKVDPMKKILDTIINEFAQ